MINQPIIWENIPETLNKEQFYKLCHISKSTALQLLKSGKVPCEKSGKKTRCYKIKKEDVKKYLKERGIHPKAYSAPAGWYNGHYTARMTRELPPDVMEKMKLYYKKLLKDYKDVLSVLEIVAITGYAKTTVNNWCKSGQLKSIYKGNKHYIPKVFLIDYLCSLQFRSITRKSRTHIQMLNDFQINLNRKCNV